MIRLFGRNWPINCPLRAGSIPSTSTGRVLPLRVSIPSSRVNGITARTLGCSRSVSRRRASLSIPSWLNSLICGTAPRIRVSISRSKPFMTDTTIINNATPSTSPNMASREIKETSRLRLPEVKLRRAKKQDRGLNTAIIPCPSRQ